MINLSSLTGNGVGQTSGAAKAPGEIGQQDFLKLMVTQLRNQDPFAPMENGEFLAQIAQFTTATGVQEMQQSFNRFSQTIATEQALQAAGLVGREVLVESPVGNLPSDGSLTGSLQLPMRLDNCKIAIYSESGELLREIPLGQQPAGEVPFSWDGKDAQGRQLPSGRYLIAASTQVDGQEVALATYTTAQVQSVTLGTGGNPPTLSLTGLGEISLSSVHRIR